MTKMVSQARAERDQRRSPRLPWLQRAALTFGLLAICAAVGAAKDAIINVSNVTIVSIDTTHLAVSRITKGKSEQLNFVLSPDTVRKGDLRAGTNVTVHYKTINGLNIATSIQSRKTLEQPSSSAATK